MTEPPFADYEKRIPPVKQHPRSPRAVVIIILIGALASLIAMAVNAYSHEAASGFQYPAACCWGPAAGRTGDCGEIPSKSVREGPNGYELSLIPGDHPKITAPLHLTVPYGKEQVSPDSKYHVCLAPDLSARCFFAGAHGS